MGQLTSQGITWKYTTRNGKIAFTHGEVHIIEFNPATSSYILEESGKILVDCKSSVECLALAPNFIRDYHARKFIPAWEV